MGFVRIMVLGATFFLVALCPRIDMALAITVIGLGVYIALWLFQFLKERDKS